MSAAEHAARPADAVDPPAGPGPTCARTVAFCAPGPGTEIFQSIVYQPQIWQADPLDVETVHAEARDRFASLLARAGGASPATPGKLLLLHGEAGSGKTHLMRAFRGMTHADGAGYFAYLQMTTEAGNYGRYLLSNVVASLDQPYHPPFDEKSGLTRLSTALFDAVPGASDADRAALRDGSAADPHAAVHEYADRLLLDRRLAAWQVDVDLLRALLHLRRDDPRVKGKVLKWLRCEDLSAFDRRALGDLVPRTQEEHPLAMVAQIGRLMAALQEAPLVVCVDQLEDMFGQDAAADRFRRVVDTLVSLLDRVPNAVVVISCLEDFYTANRQHLTRPKIDRLERDPEPVRLKGHRTFEEIEALVARRLQHLYDEAGLAAHDQPSIYPFRPEHLRPLEHFTTRNVLDHCRTHQERCILAGTWVEPDGGPAPPPSRATDGAARPAAGPDTGLESAWNDARNQPGRPVPDTEADLAGLLAWGIDQCNAELTDGVRFRTRQADRFVGVERTGPGPSRETFLVAVCEKSAKGGGLGKQIGEVERQARSKPVVLVRTYAFPKDPKTLVAKQIGKLIGTRGRRVEAENSDLRALAAFRAFVAEHGAGSGFAAWQQQSRPLSQLAAVRKVLALDRLPAVPPGPAGPVARPKAEAPGGPAAPAHAPAARKEAPAPPAGDLLLGRTRGLNESPVRVAPAELKQHMAFLGGTGSGKTTAALALIEQLLLGGVPAILLDRKGDLCRYGDPGAWAAAPAPVPPDAESARRVRELRERVEVAVYTPGAPDGRPLAIPVVPEGLGRLPTVEREQVAEFAAAALAGMMGYRPGKAADDVPRVILTKAIGVLADAPGRPVTVEAVRELVQNQDAALLNAVNGYEAKHYKKLAENLLTLTLAQGRLIGTPPGTERLDVDALLGRGGAAVPGKTRLSVINTQFLGGEAAVNFWVSQFLIALDRWRARSPSDRLQAVVLLDEADQYLPAVRQPATKAPLESLLRRARSAGLGLMLATQSPGDLDYKCRENVRAWLVGRVKEPVALNKLKPMFAETSLDVASKLPAQQTGEFFLLRERDILPVKANRSLIETRQLPEQHILELARAGR